MQNVTITTQPAQEPVTVTECKQFMRVDITDDDDLIADIIVAARALCEEYVRRKFIATGLLLALDGFPAFEREMWWDGVRDGAISELYGHANKIALPFPPAISVQSVTVYGDDNAASTVSASIYRLDTDGNLLLNDGETWPSSLRRRDAVRIAYTAGYGSNPLDVPAPIRHAIKMTVAAMYDDRACVTIPHGAMQMLAPYKIMTERGNGVQRA